MATSEFWQRLSASVASSREWEGGLPGESSRGARGPVTLWMVLDVVSILAAAMLATMYWLHKGPVDGVTEFWRGTLFGGRPMWILLALLFGFTITLMITSRRLHL